MPCVAALLNNLTLNLRNTLTDTEAEVKCLVVQVSGGR
jgi:hypothetical protein